MLEQFVKAINKEGGGNGRLLTNNLYLPRSTVFIAQVLVGPSKQLKQIIQTEHNIVKNPNWLETNQFAIDKHERGFELVTAVKQIPAGSGRSRSPIQDHQIASPIR